MTDWKKLKEEYPVYGNGTPIADNGIYTVKVDGVAVGETPSGKHYVSVKFAEGDGVRYPDIKCWFMAKNPNFRKIYYSRLFEAFGVDEAGSEKAVDKAESAGDEAKIMDQYAQLLANAASKFHTELKIEIRDQERNGELVVSDKTGKPFKEAVFTNPGIRLGGGKRKTSAPVAENQDEITMDNIPF